MRVGVVLLIAGGCSMPTIENEVVLDGRHLELHADPAIPVCTQSIESEDLYLEAVAAILEEPVADVRYYLYRENVQVCSVNQYAADCTSGTTVYASMWPHEHELVHAAAAKLGVAPAFLAEGLAEGMTSYDVLQPDERAHSVPALDSIAFFAGDTPQHYRVAADFTRYLVQRFGVAAFLKLYRSMLFLDDPLTIAQTFRRVVGVSIDSVIADWQTAPAVTLGAAFPTAMSRCLLPPTPPRAPDVWAGNEVVGCLTIPYGFGPLRQATRHTIELDTPGLVSVQVTSPGPQILEAKLEDCGQGDATHSVYIGDRARMSLGSVLPGRHSFAMSQTGDTVDTVDPSRTAQWAIVNHGPIGATCETATPVTVPDPALFAVEWHDSPLHWTRTGDTYDAWVRFDGIDAAAQTLAAFLFDNVDRTVTGTGCFGTCATPTDCKNLSGISFNWNVPSQGASLFVHLSAVQSPEHEVTVLVEGGR